MAQSDQQRTGALYAAAAFTWWGFCPLYFKAVASVAPPEVLAHRIIWSCAFLAVLLAVKGRLGELRRLLTDRRLMPTLAATTLLIAGNWLVFIWAVGAGRLLEASLGYFINPLVNVLLGFVFLKERLTRLQTLAVLLAAAGVAWLAMGGVGVPAVSLVLAFSFATYGLLRKQTPISGTVGLTVETLLLFPLAVGWLALRQTRGDLAFGHAGPLLTVLLISAGWVTALPLVWFAEGARRIRYVTVGFLQYLAPTFQFLLAVAAFGEPFTAQHAVSFGCIWVALGLYSTETLRLLRNVPAGKWPEDPHR